MSDYHLVILQFGQHTIVSTPNYFRPLGPEKISWITQQAGYKTIAITRLHNLSMAEIYDMVNPYIGKKTIIGISTSLMIGESYGSAGYQKQVEYGKMIEVLKSKYDNKVIIGGQSANEFLSFFKDAISLENFDGENDIVNFLNSHFNHGIAKKVVPHWQIQSDNFKFPVNSFVQKEEMLPVELSRGCIFSCKFCSFSRIGKEKGTYEKNIDLIRDYLINNYERFGTQYYFSTSDTMNDNDQRMNEWCDMIETLPFKIYYTGFFRLDLMYKYKNTTRRLLESGLRGINFGIESFHPTASRIIEKPFGGTKAKEFLLELNNDIFKKQVNINIGMIVGLPGEPIESVYESAEWLQTEGKEIYAHWNPLTIIDPKKSPKSSHYASKFAKNAEKYGLKWPTEDKYYWVNEHMNFKKAAVLARKFNPNHLIDNWSHVQILACNNDFSFIQNYFKNIKENAINIS